MINMELHDKIYTYLTNIYNSPNDIIRNIYVEGFANALREYTGKDKQTIERYCSDISNCGSGSNLKIDYFFNQYSNNIMNNINNSSINEMLRIIFIVHNHIHY